jgi:uncharacterized membrane protein HdeD (DUF308 family)
MASLLSASWEATFIVGVITLILGIIVTLHPSTSLNVICVLIGVIVIIGGLLRLVLAFDSANPHRALSAIVGVLMIGIGLVLIRHLHLSRLAIAFVVGVVFIVQGVVDLLIGFSGETRQNRGWLIFIGLVSIAAGIVVMASPENSITFLAILVGIWFIVLGVLGIIGSLVLRHELKKATD